MAPIKQTVILVGGLKKHVQKSSHRIIWPPKYLENTSCPLCNSNTYIQVYPQHFPRIVTCVVCRLIYTNPRLKSKYLEELYSEEYFKNDHSSVLGYSNYLQDKENIIKTFDKRLSKIETFVPVGKLLDVGCATGFFMYSAKMRGWKVEGVEISEYAASYVREHYGFKVHVGDIQRIDLPANTYDLITLWDVIEHLGNPIEAIKILKRALKKNGVLVFSTPDVRSLPAKLTKHKWIGYKLSDEHLTYFSKKTVALLLEKAGLYLISSKHVGKYVNFSLFTDRVGLYNKAVGAVLNIAQFVLPKDLGFYVNPFDIICVYAKQK